MEKRTKTLTFPSFCPHCGKKNPKRWCYESQGEDGTNYGFCNNDAPPANGWRATNQKDKKL